MLETRYITCDSCHADYLKEFTRIIESRGEIYCLSCYEEWNRIKKFKVQSYLVKFDLGPVEVFINVYHSNDQPELTRAEILEEAFGYADDAGIKLNENSLYEIETLELE